MQACIEQMTGVACLNSEPQLYVHGTSPQLVWHLISLSSVSCDSVWVNMCSSELPTRFLNKTDAMISNAGGHKLVHLQRHDPYPRRENGQARRGELGRARLEAEPR